MIHAIALRIAAATRRKRPKPDFVIGPRDAGQDYLRRWYVIPRNRWLNIYLHEFRRSDDDRALHDHPWLSLSVLLMGEYTEHRIADGGIHTRRIYKAGAVIFRRASYAHRIELHDGPCWTLFITGPRIRHWDFHCPTGWRHWEQFTDASGTSVGRGCE